MKNLSELEHDLKVIADQIKSAQQNGDRQLETDLKKKESKLKTFVQQLKVAAVFGGRL